MTESKLRPGGFAITDDAVRLCGFTMREQVLDVGCGCGETVEYLAEKYGVRVTGIDRSKRRIDVGIARNPNLALIVGDGCQLPFPGKSFDGILMECALSEMYNKTEALHEAYCVLKNGGRIAIHGLYAKQPTQEQIKRLVNRVQKTPPGDGECRTEAELLALDDCGIDGVLLLDIVIGRMEEIGFKVHKVDDRTDDLRHFAGKILLQYGSMEAYGKETELCEEGCFCAAMEKSNVGYFLLVAEKP